MITSERRKKILATLEQNKVPVSAGVLAEKFSVSRQVIVGDVALLRAEGFEIQSTPRGYVIPAKEEAELQGFVGKIVCQHKPEETEIELYTIVDKGGEVLDVSVEHPLYGLLSGSLRIRTRSDIENFMADFKKGQTKMLATLTDGIHIHTIKCPDYSTFEEIKKELNGLGILYS